MTASPASAAFCNTLPALILPNLVTLKPCTDSVVPLKEVDDSGINLPHVLVTPASFGLNHDLDLGPLGVATDAPGQKNFYVNPGYLWDLALLNTDTGGFRQFFMYYNEFNPTLGTLIFHDVYSPLTSWALVDLCMDSGYHDAFITLKPSAGQLYHRP